jgi:Tyrosyl-DNA phosphodiesterase
LIYRIRNPTPCSAITPNNWSYLNLAPRTQLFRALQLHASGLLQAPLIYRAPIWRTLRASQRQTRVAEFLPPESRPWRTNIMDLPIPDGEDEQLQLAIALSMQEENAGPAAATESKQAEAVNLGNHDGDTTGSHSDDPIPIDAANGGAKPQIRLLGLDRRAMEQERLERLAQAKSQQVSATPRQFPVARKRAFDDDSSGSPADPSRSKRQRPDHSSKDDRSEELSSITKAASRPTHTHEVPYPHGTVKRTWCLGFERSDSDIKLEEVLQKNTLQLAVLSSFIWDVDWVLAKLKPTTKTVLVMSVKDEDAKLHFRRQANELSDRSVRVCFPPMPGNVNCMHSKLMLLAHPGYLRVVVPTANLVPFDWGETGVMENTVFMIDLPRRADRQSVGPEELTSFGKELRSFCKAMGLAEDLLQSMGNFDFSATEKIAFVHTIGGEHRSTDSWRHTGYPGLGRAVRGLGLQSESPVSVDFVTSSIGALTIDFLQMLYLACKGDDGMIEYHRRTKPKSRSGKASSDADEKHATIDRAAIREGFNIYFPSEKTVQQSRGGPENGGTICFQERWYRSPTFDKSVLRDCRSAREGLLMHNKIMFVQEPSPSPSVVSEPAAVPKAWAYVGSANCSESAWGRLVKDRASQQPKLNCRNWECGVLIPIAHGGVQDVSAPVDMSKSRSLERFQDKVPVPMRLPARRLADHDLRPWFFNDVHGS